MNQSRPDVAFWHQRNRAEAIAELKLRHLARLEERMKIRGEQSDLEKSAISCGAILASERKMNNLLKKELQAEKPSATIVVHRCAGAKK